MHIFIPSRDFTFEIEVHYIGLAWQQEKIFFSEKSTIFFSCGSLQD